MKVYGISATCGMPGPGLVDAGRRVATGLLTGVASRTPHYGVGFMGVHGGATADMVFVDWWAAENELHHHVHVAESGRPETLRPRSADELTACVWDLELIAFERKAWIRCVLERPDAPDWDAYLTNLLSIGGA
jgi:hypothetical protein